MTRYTVLQTGAETAADSVHHEEDAALLETNGGQMTNITGVDLMRAITSLKHDFHTEIVR